MAAPVRILARSRPVGRSHRWIVLSFPPEASRLPSGEKASAEAASVWPLNARNSLPVVTSTSLTVLPSATAFVLPSGDVGKLTLSARAAEPISTRHTPTRAIRRIRDIIFLLHR